VTDCVQVLGRPHSAIHEEVRRVLKEAGRTLLAAKAAEAAAAAGLGRSGGGRAGGGSRKGASRKPAA